MRLFSYCSSASSGHRHQRAASSFVGFECYSSANVILKILTNSRVIVHGIDVKINKESFVADFRQLEELRRAKDSSASSSICSRLASSYSQHTVLLSRACNDDAANGKLTSSLLPLQRMESCYPKWFYGRHQPGYSLRVKCLAWRASPVTWH